MTRWCRPLVLLLGFFSCSGSAPCLFADDSVSAVRIAVWNVRNYLIADRMVDGRYHRAYPKPESGKSALRTVLRSVDADVLAFQEMGDERFLFELQRDLKREGCDYPHAALLTGPDADRHLAVLSRIPFAQVIPHADLPIHYLQTEGVVKRGLLEIVFSSGGREWRLFNLHLKSRYTDRMDDPNSIERRNAEASAIRDLVDEQLRADPEAALFVVGDFNDHRASRPLRRFLQINERPFLEMLPVGDDRGDSWTHFFAKEEAYERIDFVLLSPAARAMVTEGSAAIPDSPAMRTASDHRLIVFQIEPNRRK